MLAMIHIRPEKPLEWEARAYCREYALEFDDLERGRLMLAVREYHRRMEPWIKNVARLMSMLPLGSDENPQVVACMAQLRRVGDMEQESLGLKVDA